VPQLHVHLAAARSRARIASATLFDHLRGDFTHDRSTNATELLLGEQWRTILNERLTGSLEF
jgi:hypothetical protein